MDNDSNQIDEIKNRLDIVQVIEKYVPLKQAGKNYSGLCPFHHEKTPSFIVSPDIQRYKCFGCGESGDVFNFIQKIENLDFFEALQKLAKESGVELKHSQNNSKYSRLEDINYIAAKYYYNQLKINKIALEYISQKRNFSHDSIKQFGIGYAPKYPTLLKYIGKNKFKTQELIDSGLFVMKNGRLKEKFYDRIMFPIRSPKGKVIGFSGRVMPGNDYGPKYMNSPETPIFHKKYNLFGQYESKSEIRRNDLAILCEGQTDVISAHQHGIKNIVAPLGTGLTKEQLESLSKLTKNILFFFDSDTAGQNAVIRAFKLASELNLYPYAANSEPYKDIDEMLLAEPQAMVERIEKKQEAFSYIVSSYIRDKDLTKLKDLTDTQRFLKDLISVVSTPTLQKHYKAKISKLIKIDIDLGKNADPISPEVHNLSKTFLVKSNDFLLEKTYLQLLLFGKIQKSELLVPSRYLASPALKEIYLKIKHNIGKEISDISKLFKNESEQKILFEEIIFKSTEIEEDIEEQLQKIVVRLRKEYLMRQQKALSVKIAIAEESNNSSEADKLLVKMQRLTKLLKEI
jgi:DNA primase